MLLDLFKSYQDDTMPIKVMHDVSCLDQITSAGTADSSSSSKFSKFPWNPYKVENDLHPVALLTRKLTLS